MSLPLRPPRHLPLLAPLVVSGVLAGGCAGGTPAASAPPDMTYVSSDPLIVARPYEFRAPQNYDAAKAWPLVVLLHGYRANPFFIDALFMMSNAVDEKGFVYAFPPATTYDAGSTRWNAQSDANGPDDMAYLDAVIGDMSKRYRVDPRRIFVAGHSNGAEMAYRYGCERADRIAAIVACSGTYSTDPMKCAPQGTISVLHVNGDIDPNWPGMPPVRNSPVYWAERGGCSATSDTSPPPLDLDSRVPGAETTVERWPGCRAGAGVELWVIHGAAHHPNFQPTFAPTLIDWLNRHARQ